MRRTTIFAIAVLLLAATVGLTSSGTLLALSQHELPGKAQRTLTLQERVLYQRAIEEVYWRHRIWPKENANPKPSLDAVMSQSQLETDRIFGAFIGPNLEHHTVGADAS